MIYPSFFKIATGNDPYPWQCRLACGDAADLDNQESLSGYGAFESRLIDIPTGLGKTAGVVMAWLWNYLYNRDGQVQPIWPRRLVFNLPMRTLVEQTEQEVARWLGNLWQERDKLEFSEQALDDLSWLCGHGEEGKEHSPVVLMGGEDLSPAKREWDIWPEKPCILIGTQDMLLSRALNRGYGMSRYRWPMHFALLNNDALWVMDEVQLMGVGVETSAQLEGLRQSLGMLKKASTWWMSATLASARLGTPDFNQEELSSQCLQLSGNEANSPAVAQRVNASKQLAVSELKLESVKADSLKAYAQELSVKVLAAHEPGSLTLVILNRVDRAQNLFRELDKSGATVPLALIHSRFRPEDRVRQMRLLESPEGGILVATQAIEAGLDISARLLLTELAPWSSLVQRFGRCNRDGMQPQGGFIQWIDLSSEDKRQIEALALPYTPEALEKSRTALMGCSSASSADLRQIHIAEENVIRPIIRRKDFLDLFDTTADLAGQDLDVSTYIRDGEDTDVEVFWRSFADKEAPTSSTAKPSRDEICRVSISSFRTFVKGDKKKRIWRWQALTGEWERVDERSLIPGKTYLLASAAGGYSPSLGWTGDRKIVVPVLETAMEETSESDADNTASFAREKETLTSHSSKVCALTNAIATILTTEKQFREALQTAAVWHDIGKSHEVFQQMLNPEGVPPVDSLHYLAKSEGNGRCERKHFRHELASALAWLAASDSSEVSERDLVAYIIAAHHGKVRTSIRAMPTETGPDKDPSRSFARGVWDGETLPPENWPAIQLNGKELPPLRLDLSILALGHNKEGAPSWLERTLRLRDRGDLGPFRLAFLEALLRAADARASYSA